MRNLFIAFILLIISNSCIKEYNIDLEFNQHRLVVDGVITNQNGPHYIMLTKSLSKLTSDDYTNRKYVPILNGYITAELINDAQVYITDNDESITDTLIRSWTLYRNLPDTAWKSFIFASDSISYYGCYQTSRLKGIPGHTYSITVKWQDKEYHATSFMPPVPPIDSVRFNFTKGAVGKNDFNIPLLYFKEPQNEKNYYLFITPGSSRVWPYSILSDEYLKDYVNGLDVCKGVSPDYWMTAYPYTNADGSMDDYFIEMHSLPKETYDYYKSLLHQFRTDGGGYSPSPASPPTNMDNGALGFFRASAVNRVDFKREYPNQDIMNP